MPMTQKCKDRKQGLNTLTAPLRTLTQPLMEKRGFASLDILENWEYIAGATVAAGSQVQKLTFPAQKRTNGTVHIKVFGGAYALLIQQQRAAIVERINRFLGYPAVDKIQIHQGEIISPPVIDIQTAVKISPLQKLHIKAAVQEIDNPEIAEVLSRIGQKLYGKK